MAVLTALPSMAIVDGFKGTIDFYVHDGTPCARKWPRSTGKKRSPAVEAQWPAFIIASQLWSQLDEATQRAYVETAAGANLSGRDLATKAYLSGYLKT